MFTVKESEEFTAWSKHLRDMRVKAAVLSRIKRAGKGNLGDVKVVGDGVSEMRIDLGPGYRLYFIKSGKTIIVLLCGGDKSTQQRDIEKAKKLAKEIHP